MGKTKDEIEMICAYCEKASVLVDEERMLCEDRGVVACDNRCRKFIYDPLKRTPAPPSKPVVDGLDLKL